MTIHTVGTVAIFFAMAVGFFKRAMCRRVPPAYPS